MTISRPILLIMAFGTCVLIVGGVRTTDGSEVIDRDNHIDSSPEIVGLLTAEAASARVNISVTRSDFASIGRFCDDDDPYMALVVHETPNAHSLRCLLRRFPPQNPQPGIFVIGQRRIAVVVHPREVRESISAKMLGAILAQSAKATGLEPAGRDRGEISVYDDGAVGLRDLLRRTCMAYTEDHPGYTSHEFHAFRDDIRSLSNGDAVVEKVRRDPHGLGLFWYGGQEIKGVKLLTIASDDESAPVALITEPKIQQDYPLAEPLMLYIHPTAPKDLWDFCRFCTGPKAAEIVASHGFMTPYHKREYAGNERVKAFLAGGGERVTAVGLTAIREAIPDLATEYARAEAPTQISFRAVTSEGAAIGAFLSDRSGAPDLLFVINQPNEKGLAAHATAWHKLAPAEHVLAGRAMAVIVNAANQLDMLPQENVKAIFCGEANDWDAIGVTGLPPATKRRGTSDVPINRFSIRGRDAVALVVRGESQASKTVRTTLLPDTKSVIAAVTLDPHAIGLVNLSELPRTGQTVKALGIEVAAAEPGHRPAIIHPTTETIRTKAYPFADRLLVYLHPNASDAAKGFVEFLATCGGSDGAPEDDAVQMVMSAYHKHGWRSLADAAIQREAQDAAAEAAAKSAPPRPVRGKRK